MNIHIIHLMSGKIEHDVPYFHPAEGWMIGNEHIDEESAEILCGEKGIPYEKPDSDSPNRRAFLIRTHVSGCEHVEGFQTRIDGMKMGDRVRLIRERDNRYDPRAIMICREDGRKLGYVPRRYNLIPSNLMDSGATLFAEISGRSSDGLEIMLFMEMHGKKVRRHFSHHFDINWEAYFIDSVPASRSNMYVSDQLDRICSFTLHRRFTDDDIWNLRWGHVSKSMEDRWNMMFEDGHLIITRSWTGLCVFDVTLSEDDEHEVHAFNMVDVTQDYLRKILNNLLDMWLSDAPIPADRIPGSITGNIRPTYERSDWKWVERDGMFCFEWKSVFPSIQEG